LAAFCQTPRNRQSWRRIGVEDFRWPTTRAWRGQGAVWEVQEVAGGLAFSLRQGGLAPRHHRLTGATCGRDRLEPPVELLVTNQGRTGVLLHGRRGMECGVLWHRKASHAVRGEFFSPFAPTRELHREVRDGVDIPQIRLGWF
jgi:hypothetical protein